MSAAHDFLHLPYVHSGAHGFMRRFIDIMISALGLALAAPLLAMIGLAVWLEGGSPIFFAQTRIGAGGQPFRMYKFRKFTADCDTSGCPLTTDGDRRMTRIGRLLAATKFDELPQLWNVLVGDMAIVGPRPESLAFADCFRGGLEAVLQYKPGLVGPSQVFFRHESRHYPAGQDPVQFYRRVLFPAKVMLDLAYFEHRSLAGDFAWMARAALAVLGIVPEISADRVHNGTAAR